MIRTSRLLFVVYSIYFLCGLTMCFEGVFLPEFKEFFHLNYEQQMYTMFAKNMPFAFALVIGYLVARIGYKKFLTIALLFFGFGTALLVPALMYRHYWMVLSAFLLIGIGFNFEIVSGNPLLYALGPRTSSSSRLNLGNAFGAVAQIIAPATLSVIVPAAATTVVLRLAYMEALFAVLGLVLLVFAAVTMPIPEPAASTIVIQDASAKSIETQPASRVWLSYRLLFGLIVIALALGVEAGYFALFRNYLEDNGIAGMTARRSQQLFTVFLAAFAAGRLSASIIQSRISPRLHLLLHCILTVICLAVILSATGSTAVTAMIILGFLISIFYPTLFAIAIQGSNAKTGQASGLLTIGFLGAGIIPVLQGWIADRIGLQRSYVLGVLSCVATIAYTFAFSKNTAQATAGKVDGRLGAEQAFHKL